MSALARSTRRLRPMRPSDVPEVARIERAAYPYPWDEAFFRTCLLRGFSSWVLERDGEIHGYGVMAIDDGRAHILNLCVRPESQGQGHGGRILAQLLRQARRRGIRRALLEVRPSNRPARDLYRRMGFSRLGIRRAYYPARGGREDALVLVRRL